MMPNRYEWRARVQGRLTNQKGETLAETLVSILVSSLALLMLAMAIGTTVRVVMSSRAFVGDFYQKESQLVSNASATTPPDDLSTETVTPSVPLSLNQTTGKANASEDVNVYSDATDGGGDDATVYLYTRKEVTP
ncbi:MAG: hypothetical protein IKG18_06700 [Atopobiaceae bacterium]|nr:hypothetical protein [Atopobiaceae bacterium]